MKLIPSVPRGKKEQKVLINFHSSKKRGVSMNNCIIEIAVSVTVLDHAFDWYVALMLLYQMAFLLLCCYDIATYLGNSQSSMPGIVLCSCNHLCKEDSYVPFQYHPSLEYSTDGMRRNDVISLPHVICL